MWAHRPASRALLSQATEHATCSKRALRKPVAKSQVRTIAFVSARASKKSRQQQRLAVACHNYSTDSSAQAPAQPEKMSLKNALRKFYMIVHPDRLTGQPKEQRTNDDSFRSLNSYLDTYKNENASNDDLERVYEVKFYVPKKGEAGFTVATSRLVQPSRGSSQQARERHIHDSIVSLFHQCGLDIDVDVSGYGAPAGAAAGAGANAGPADPPIFKALMNMTAHLSAHANKNSPAGKKLAHIYQTHQKTLEQQIKDLNKKHKIPKIMTDLSPFHYKSSIDRSQAVAGHIKKIDQALDKLKSSGVVLHAKMGSQPVPSIILSHKKTGWSHNGHFYVDVDHSVDDLHSLFEEHAHPEALARVQQLTPKRVAEENTLKTALDLASVSAEHGVHSRENYLHLLQSIGQDIAANSHKWALPQVARGKVNLRFTEDHLPVDASTASLLLPYDSAVEHVRTFVTENAGETAKKYLKLDGQMKALQQLLGVKSLTYQPGMDVDHLMEAAKRLTQAADQIRPFVKGVNLVIAKQYGINEDQQQVMIKWNFYL